MWTQQRWCVRGAQSLAVVEHGVKRYRRARGTGAYLLLTLVFKTL